MATPSSRRREGRKAFSPGEDPKEHCPYRTGPGDMYGPYFDWINGWNEAQADYDQEEKVTQLEDELWDSHKYGCPWFASDVCTATRLACEKENCAPYYWKDK